MSNFLNLYDAERVAVVEIQRPPLNFLDVALIRSLADALEAIDDRSAVRAVVLAAQGKAFCAGADFSSGEALKDGSLPVDAGELYRQAVRLFGTRKPIVAAVHGAAVGGGLGLAMAADFRVVCPQTRLSANFTSLGFHPGFGLTVTLPETIGKTNAELMFYTSRRVDGEQALAMGLASMLVPQDRVLTAAISLAQEIAACSPLGLVETRATLRSGLSDRVRAATERELEAQDRLRRTDDFREGVRAVAERRPANFQGC
jgi:enoyl-CoA hydratase/carnithine racemase